ncbi:MAG: polysaccharide deacetylase family protein [Clostridia bacterium]|nr:polysaccharide deacetylase family protein [Clostridia bacterium]
MKKFFLQSLLLSLTFCTCFSACNSAKTPQNKFFSSSVTEANPIEKNDDTVWDLSDVNTTMVQANRNLIAFTFDDSPSKTLENIFAVFASFNEQHPDCPAFATVFFNGGLFRENSLHLLHTALALGFELGNHTQSHLNLTTLDEPSLQKEIDDTDALLAQADGKPRHLLRAPYGSTNEQVKACAPTPLISWNIDTLDWTGASAERISETVLSNLSDGAIVLMHDGHKETVNALKILLPALYEKNYQVVNVSQLAKAHNCVMRKGKEYIRLRKQA